MQAENREPTLYDVLDELKGTRLDIAETNKRLDTEVKRWDDRFFKFSEDSANRANTLIAGATISVITGVSFLLLKQ